MERQEGPAARSARRLIAFEMLGACLAILVVAQAFIGMLGLASFSRLATDATVERVALLARSTAAQIENGLRLGKPMAQYTGLARLLEDTIQGQQDVVRISVILPDGHALEAIGQPRSPHGGLSRAVAGAGAEPPGMRPLADGGGTLSLPDRIGVSVPLRLRDGAVAGALTLWVDAAAQQASERAFLKHSAGVLALTTAGAALLLVLVLLLVPPGEGTGTRRLALPLAAMLLAQGLYALDATTSFRSAWLESTRGNVVLLAERTQRDLARVFEMGVDLERVRGMDSLFQRLAGSLPAIDAVILRDAQGRVMGAADAAGPLDRGALPVGVPVADDMRVVLPLAVGGEAGARRVGTLEVTVDARVVAAGVRARVLDAATVALISAIAAFEMFLLVIVLVTRARGSAAVPAMTSTRAEDVARIARPLMFGFLFAWALPLSFLPLYAGTLRVLFLGLPESILMALPISAEMLCGLFGALLAGRLTDRRGWRSAVVVGLCVAGAGSFASAMIQHLEVFVLTRGLVGLGYGLAWMGLQGLVVSRSSPVFRGRNMAWLIAGLFAGHLSGTAAGAMLADQVSYRPVFVVGGLLMLLPLLGVMLLRTRPIAGPAAKTRPGSLPVAADRPVSRVPPPRGRWADLRSLILSRDYGALLAGSIVPFSIAQVGLLYFALPLYLQALGVAASSIGRVLMLYGLCIIYLGPAVGRLVDRSPHKKPFIALGGLLGGLGMTYLYFDHSLLAVSVAVFLLALGSCWCGAAQTSWMLSLPRVQDYGPGAATSILRAADKFGQMVGPLFVGSLFTIVGISAGLAITGVFYVCATLMFIVLSAGRPVPRPEGEG
ncbi:MFS transporter [Verticiella sediminum]|uniref:MFS transporter n=1 Tax=Verticiella sediminum TaxID=1247510 RepID=A0A556AQD1_9BURK|nr:MFS transporter [Verticiella sediminum]TSH95100.1 MFS transporter [Verticiella sediminum]